MSPAKKVFLVIVLLLIWFVFSGCAAKTGPDPGDNGAAPDPVENGSDPGKNGAVPVPGQKITGLTPGAIEIRGKVYPVYDYHEAISRHLLVNGRIIQRTMSQGAGEAGIISFDLEKGEIVWRRELGKDGFDLAFDPNFSDIVYYTEWLVFKGGLIYAITDSSGGLYLEKLDINDGKLLWRQKVWDDYDSSTHACSLVQANDKLIVISADYSRLSSVIAVHSMSSGKQVFTVKGAAVKHEKYMYLLMVNSLLVKYDLSTGSKIWETNVNLDPSAAASCDFRAVDAEKSMVFSVQLYNEEGKSTETVFALDKFSGKLLWKKDGFNLYLHKWSSKEAETLAGDAVVMGFRNQTLLVHKNTGNVIRSFNKQIWPRTAGYEGKLFLCGEDTLIALEQATANVLWEKNRVGTAFTGYGISHGQVFLSSQDNVFAYNPSTGSLLWEKSMRSPLLLLGRPGILWLLSITRDFDGGREGNLVALDPKTGREVCSFQLKWAAGGALTWPIEVITPHADGWRFDYLSYITRQEWAKDAETVYIVLYTGSQIKVINADTGQEVK